MSSEENQSKGKALEHKTKHWEKTHGSRTVTNKTPASAVAEKTEMAKGLRDLLKAQSQQFDDQYDVFILLFYVINN